MEKLIFIIEDDARYWEAIISILKKYEVRFYPENRSDFKVFYRLLEDYELSRTEVDLEKIRSVIAVKDPDLFLLDIIFTKRDRTINDRFGLTIREKILDTAFREKPIRIISGKPANTNPSEYIDKHNLIALESEIKLKALKELNVEKRTESETDKGETKTGKGETKAGKEETMAGKGHTEDYSNVEPSKWLTEKYEQNRYKVFPFITGFSALIYQWVFVLLIIISFGIGLIYLYQNFHYGNLNIIHFAESIFLAFLPFLILFGFFVFYKFSLKRHLGEENPFDNDYNTASQLMDLTKKLFFSSLISYLFIKLIELINLPDEVIKSIQNDKLSTVEKINKINNIPSINTNLQIRIYFLAGCILFLIGFYIYLKSHDKHKEKHHQG